MQNHFSDRSGDYARFRPKYPRELAEALADLCPGKAVALDCCCGTGQLSVPLAEFFGQVVATDASSEQIKHAELHPGVTYRVASAEESGLEAASVDLVTIAQAAHWIDLVSFYTEAKRILKKGGVLAFVTYGVFHMSARECGKAVQDFYANVLDPYWPPERQHIEAGYRTLFFPFRELELPQLLMEANWSFHELFGYISTWSAYKQLEKAGGGAAIERFRGNLAMAWGDAATRRRIVWPLSVRVARI